MKRTLRIYIHIPFCISKCNYCDFNSFAKMEHLAKPYIDSIITEISLYSKHIRNGNIDSIYIGGGTPSCISEKYIEKLLSCFSFDDKCEITIEVNPGTVDYKKFIEYKRMGINRASVGVQSLNDRILSYMGRMHDRTTAIKCVQECRAAGFENISTDIIFGYPHQTYEHVEDTLNVLKSLDVEHVSAYSLSVEQDTLLYNMIKKGVMPDIDESLDRRMYYLCIESLKKAGIMQYEISNFAKEGFQSRHNIGYWERDEYLGFGISAHSLYDETRYSNLFDIHEYIAKLNRYELPVAQKSILDPKEIMSEYIFLRLRMNKGLDIASFFDTFKVDFEETFSWQLEKLKQQGLIDFFESVYYLTPKGMDMANCVFMEFI